MAKTTRRRRLADLPLRQVNIPSKVLVRRIGGKRGNVEYESCVTIGSSRHGKWHIGACRSGKNVRAATGAALKEVARQVHRRPRY